MTRNRDDFSLAQAIRTGFLAIVAIVTLMIVLGLAIADQKEAAKEKAINVAAASLQLSPAATETAAAQTADQTAAAADTVTRG